jgi:hypothetical protein
MRSKRTTGTVESFKSEFWQRVKANSTAWDVMNKIPGKKHNRVVGLLEVLSHPSVDEQMKEAGKEINALFLQSLFRLGPSRKELRNLARKLRTLALQVDRMLSTDRVSFKRELFLEFAENCRARARDLKYIDMARRMNPAPRKPRRTLTYKAFWKHLPIAMLCRELEAPWAVSFTEIEKLLRCAYSVRNLPFTRPARSVEREYNGFRKLKSSNPVNSAAWPKLIDKLLLSTWATK